MPRTRQDLEQIERDYLAGMTDRYVMREYERLFGAKDQLPGYNLRSATNADFSRLTLFFTGASISMPFVNNSDGKASWRRMGREHVMQRHSWHASFKLALGVTRQPTR